MARVPMLGSAGDQQGDQRADPLCAGRQSADRADAGRAECVRGLRLHLRHRAGRRCGQGAGRMDDRGRRPSGTCGRVDPRRFTDYTDQDYCIAKGDGGLWPRIRHAFPASRMACRARQEAVVAACRGWWTRARCSGPTTAGSGRIGLRNPATTRREEATQTWDRNGPWEARIKEECEAVRDGCGILPITGFSRLSVEGAGARDWLDGLTASRLPTVGPRGAGLFRR